MKNILIIIKDYSSLDISEVNKHHAAIEIIFDICV